MKYIASDLNTGGCGPQPIVWKLVLTGGPCGGKTTGQARLSTFFENLGWKVYRVPETATILIPGGVSFAELDDEMKQHFQKNLLKTMLQIETSFFDLARYSKRNCLVICDRGAMDASAYISRSSWEAILADLSLDEVEIRDDRYNQIIHMATAAKGAENFYTIHDNIARTEGLEEARSRDDKAIEAWVGHPYVDIVDNSEGFEEKIKKMISLACNRIGVNVGDRLYQDSHKIKFVVHGPLPADLLFPNFRDFEVCHHYLRSNNATEQTRLRKRGRNGKFTYTHTIRKHISGQLIEIRSALSHRDYINIIAQADPNNFPIHKIRRCFVYKSQYFQLDIYKEPFHHRCKALMLLETYTTKDANAIALILQDFISIGKNVTGDPAFSMFNLSLRDEWSGSEKFCQSLHAKFGEDIDDFQSEELTNEHGTSAANEAHHRFLASRSKIKQ